MNLAGQKCQADAILCTTKLQNCLLHLKWTIFVVSPQGEIRIFQISSKKSFINSTTALPLPAFICKNIILQNYSQFKSKSKLFTT